MAEFLSPSRTEPGDISSDIPTWLNLTIAKSDAADFSAAVAASELLAASEAALSVGYHRRK